jgi:hypothetical protein
MGVDLSNELQMFVDDVSAMNLSLEYYAVQIVCAHLNTEQLQSQNGHSFNFVAAALILQVRILICLRFSNNLPGLGGYLGEKGRLCS